MPDLRLPGPVLAHDLRLVLAHLLGDLAHRLVDGGIQVARLRAGVDGDVVVAMEHHLGDVPVLFDIQDHLRIDDSRVIEVEALHFFSRIFDDGIGDGHVAAGDFDFGFAFATCMSFLRFTF